jgi:hypothetical protein
LTARRASAGTEKVKLMTPYQEARVRRACLFLLLASPLGCGDNALSASDAGAHSSASGRGGDGGSGGSAGAAGSSIAAAGRLADGIVGKACETNPDCGTGSCQKTIAVVNTPYPGGYCSGRCLSDDACGANGVCVPGILGAVGSCFLRCDEASGCKREGYRCRVVSNVGRCVAAPSLRERCRVRRRRDELCFDVGQLERAGWVLQPSVRDRCGLRYGWHVHQRHQYRDHRLGALLQSLRGAGRLSRRVRMPFDQRIEHRAGRLHPARG